MQSWVFLGNPGAGKSTLANCLAHKPVFEAGLSFGSGKTTHAQSVQHDGIQLIDTPGLADTALKETAAIEISKGLALAAGGPCKLFFFVSLRSGRVVAEDVTTINMILRSIATPNISFTVIVNNVQQKQYARLMEGGAVLRTVTASICSGQFATPFIFFIPVLLPLHEQDNALVELPSEIVRVFREETPSFFLETAMLQTIQMGTGAFQSQMLSSQQKIEMYTKNSEATEAKIGELTQTMPSFLDTLYWIATLGIQIFLNLAVGG